MSKMASVEMRKGASRWGVGCAKLRRRRRKMRPAGTTLVAKDSLPMKESSCLLKTGELDSIGGCGRARHPREGQVFRAREKLAGQPSLNGCLKK